IKGYEIPEANKTARGRAVVNILPLAAGEKVAAMLPVLENGTGYLVMATTRGSIKKTKTSECDHILRSGKIAIRINEDDELISVQVSTGEDDILVASRFGKCIRFKEADVRPMGRDTTGVRAISLSEGDEAVDMIVLREG